MAVSNKSALANLKNAYRSGHLNLYLGAGVSMASGLPSWKKLVVSMYFRYMAIEQWERIRPFPNYLYAIGEWYLSKTNESLDIIIRKLKSNLDDDLFQQFVYECLYNPLNQRFASFSENMLLREIASLITNPNQRINTVLTYNFDDLLEQKLLEQNYEKFTTVFDEHGIPRNGSLPVYHPHGFVPFKKNVSGMLTYGKIILSEDDYNIVANRPDYWGNLLQVSRLSSGTGLMIGLSLTDRNLRRLLDLIARIPATTNNYILLKKNEPPALTDEDVIEIKKNADSIVDLMRKSGIKADSHVFDNTKIILEEIIRMEGQISDSVFEQMRIKPIWFDDYSDMIPFIESIKK